LAILLDGRRFLVYSPPNPGIYVEIFDTQGQRRIPLTQRRHVLGDAADCDIRLYPSSALTYQTILVWHAATYRALDVDLNIPGKRVVGVDLRDGDRIIFADNVTAMYHCSSYPPEGSMRLLRPPPPPPTASGTAQLAASP
jgi:hypothetical protein